MIQQMKKNSFHAIAGQIEDILGSHAWRQTALTNQSLKLDAQDVGPQVRHTLLIGVSLCPEGDDASQIGIDCQVNICFPELEAHIAKALNRQTASGLSSVLGFSQMVPTDLLYEKTSFLIDGRDPAAVRRDGEQFVRLYRQYVEPVRSRLSSVRCLEDPGFYPHDCVFPLSWELRRAAYYHRTLPSSQFSSYINELRQRLNDYERGLPDVDQTPNFMVGMASQAIAELRALTISFTATRP